MFQESGLLVTWLQEQIVGCQSIMKYNRLLKNLTFFQGRESESASHEGSTYIFLCFRLAYYREYDRRPFRKGVSIVVIEQDSRPHILEPDLLLTAGFAPSIHEMARKIFQNCPRQEGRGARELE